MREGQARFVEWYGRSEGFICGGRSECSAVSVGARQVVETGCRCAAASCQRVRREFPRGLRQVSGPVEPLGAETLPKDAFQDYDFRLRHHLYRLRQPHGCRHRYERRRQPQLRGRHPHRRAPTGRCRSRPPRQHLARDTMYKVQEKSLLWRQNIQIKTTNKINGRRIKSRF